MVQLQAVPEETAAILEELLPQLVALAETQPLQLQAAQEHHLRRQAAAAVVAAELKQAMSDLAPQQQSAATERNGAMLALAAAAARTQTELSDQLAGIAAAAVPVALQMDLLQRLEQQAAEVVLQS